MSSVFYIFQEYSLVPFDRQLKRSIYNVFISSKSAFGSAVQLFSKLFKLLQNVLYRLINLFSIFLYILQQKLIMDILIIKNINFA